MKILIAGCGKVGQALAQELCAEGHDLTLIDSRSQVLNSCVERFDVIEHRRFNSSLPVQAMRRSAFSTPA